jgi:hypothetical protein
LTVSNDRLGFAVHKEHAMGKAKVLLERWWMVLVLLLALPFFVSTALSNEKSVDYVNNGFFTFWLSGQMTWTTAQPYATADWVGGHHLNGATWIPNKIFPYPLPLALFTAPLGLLPINQAYLLWEILSQIIVVLTIFWLATFWEGFNRRVFAAVLLLAALVNSNIRLMLMTGTIGALFLLFLALALYFMDRQQNLPAGICLAMLALKPPLLTVVALIGLWLLFRRNWKALGGIILGGLALLVVGMFQDLNWVAKFRGASENLFNMRLGNQPTIISYTRLACGGNLTCAFISYAVIALALIGLFAWLAWRKRETLTPLTVFSAAIPLGMLLPPYVWSYDYVLLLIPWAYICFEWIQRKASYLQATLFLIVLDALSFAMMALFMNNPESPALTIQRDMWSIWVGLLTIITAWWLVFRAPAVSQKPPTRAEVRSEV